ncbi:FtsW/RodA/SpoVE family cell cycle protein [Robertmurraya sp. DFI.2.37]|uniref:FtsW/RodA/SpoVE family cell cycle protein n=1 Tax=Robertmurraya sp. DFI.2.37 TaxID=3031819 RepID=UPI0012460F39|nr:FtsW/RodA/SpoVE family cell cycle protein [Robertmurraya sp. DFI.2.37]MDF1508594.1 FtsW/RodA/SpoVE family cell cycle protein [Robertmurraya sp. DFI.2.37]
MDKKNKVAEKFDWTLSFILLLFFLTSCAAIYSAQTTEQYNENYFLRQIIYYAIGAIIIAIVMFFDSYQYRKLSWYLYGFGILLLVVLYLLPPSDFTPIRNGAKSWFVIPGFGSIQPSEFMKVFLILTLSKLIADHHEKNPLKTTRTDFILLVKLGLATLPPLVLIAEQDLGTALVIIAIFVGMILISGMTWKILLPVFSAGAALVAAIFYIVIHYPELLEKHIDTYQYNRIYSWLDPESYQGGAGYHLYKSLQAIGSGLITGKGFGERVVYIPESHTDFIFSVIGEEYGFAGASIVIGLFFILIYHLTKTALDTNDPFNTYICVGIISMIAFHVFQNIGMTIQVLPITGIPLPFISSGGSSLMANMFAMGLIYSIRYHHKSYMFGSTK